jgi:hypothetical protein
LVQKGRITLHNGTNGDKWGQMGAIGYAIHSLGTGTGAVCPTETPKNQDGANGNDPPPPKKKVTFDLGLASPNRYIAQTLLVINSYI